MDRTKEGKAFLGRGWSFPVRLDGHSGQLSLSEYDDDVWEAIKLLLGTRKGERRMRPIFGCGIHDLVFEINDATVAGLIIGSVREAITRFEHRVDLLDVRVRDEQAESGVLEIEIDFRIRESNHELNRVYDFYLPGGS